jgi:AraC family transcriptional regulator of adaptative response / DNA-3-methyladenine glycosylase II
VRRFNAAIRITYHRSPTQIRALARQTGTQPENHYRFRLNFRPPYNWPVMLRFLEARATPGVELVDQAHQLYRRSISVDGVHGCFEVSPDEGRNALAVRVQFGDPRSLFLIIERIRAMFDLNADWATIVGSLRNDPVLAARVQANPGVRVPGCWDGFELAIRAIVGQQVTVQRATDLAGRIVSAFGPPFPSGGGLTHLFPAPEALADGNFSGIGLTKARSETVRALARAVCGGHISFKGVIDSQSFLAKLCEIPGIGTWTAQYVAMRALGEPDAFPSGDVALLRSLDLESASALEAHAEAWRPWRAYAAMYLWSIAGEAMRDRHRSEASRVRKLTLDKRESHPPTSLAG